MSELSTPAERREAREQILATVRLLADRLESKVLKQAGQAGAIARGVDGTDALFELLDHDLPDTMTDARYWRVFRREVASPLRQIRQDFGDWGVHFALGWLRRLGQVKEAGAPRGEHRRSR